METKSKFLGKIYFLNVEYKSEQNITHDNKKYIKS